MSNYFELSEFLHSDTAAKNGIQNYPAKFEYVEHLLELRDYILNPLREAWGSAIIVTSGFRCPQLNKLLKGASKTSVHQIGYAVDIVPANGKFEEFVAFCKKFFVGKYFDEIIIESSGKSRWIHVSLYSNAHTQRRLIFDMVV